MEVDNIWLARSNDSLCQNGSSSHSIWILRESGRQTWKYVIDSFQWMTYSTSNNYCCIKVSLAFSSIIPIIINSSPLGVIIVQWFQPGLYVRSQFLHVSHVARFRADHRKNPHNLFVFMQKFYKKNHKRIMNTFQKSQIFRSASIDRKVG